MKENRIYKVLLPFSLAFLFLFTERSLKGIALFEFSYIAINMHTAIAFACSWLVIAFFVFNKRSLDDWMVIIAYSTIFAGYAISTLLNKGNMFRWFDNFIYSLPPIMLVGLAKDKMQLYKILSWLFLAVSVLNIAFCFIPSLWSFAFEWHEEFFIGFQNAVGWPLVLGMLFNMLDYKYNGNKARLVIYIVSFFINVVVVWCVTALVGGMIIAVYLIFPFIRKWFKKWNFLTFVFVAVMVFIFLVFFYEKIISIKPVEEFLWNVLKKDASLSGRTDVWRTYKEAVLQSPIIGYGFSDSPAALFVSGWFNNCFIHAHNEWLQTLYEGGALTLAAGFSMLVVIGRKIRSGVCKMILFTLLIMLQADMIAYYTWYITAFVLEVGIIENTQCD